MTTIPSPTSASKPQAEFVGLAPFLRMSIAGTDFLPIAQGMLARAQSESDDANLWMNLSTAMLCLGQRDLGLAIQAQALGMKRVYHLAAMQQPAKLRVLMLLVPGDLAANIPLDCLLENSDIDLDFYYVGAGAGAALAEPVPDHDVLIVGMSAADDCREILAELEHSLANWPKPVINRPSTIPTTERNTASRLLQNAPGLLIPPTLRASRSVLLDIAAGKARLADLFDGCEFPIILRPIGSHAGRDLDRIAGPEELAAYLARVNDAELFLARFIDYSGPDGLFRKFRVVLVDGQPFASHMAVSSHWMVHYVNADMYEDAQKRTEEAGFMANFADFARRHQSALNAIHERTGLDYVCIDCAETADGQLLVFEIDHAMVVHAMDPEDLFPYKLVHMQKVKDAFRDYLFRLRPPP